MRTQNDDLFCMNIDYITPQSQKAILNRLPRYTTIRDAFIALLSAEVKLQYKITSIKGC